MTKPPFVNFVIALSMTGAALPALAGIDGGPGGGYSSETTTTMTSIEGAAERELARRQEDLIHAQEAIEAGDAAMDAKDYEVAFAQYRLAVDLLPESPETHRQREHAKDGLCTAGIKLAELRIEEGRFADAKTVLQLILEERYVPDCKPALVMLARFEDPDYYNQTITPRFAAQIEEVKTLLLEAQQYYDTGRYDRAMRRYERVLNLDPYNSAARKGQEMVNKMRQNYAVDAYNEARSRMIWQVENGWQRPVRKFGPAKVGGYETSKGNERENQELLNKMNRIIIPQVQFKEATVREAVDFLKQKSIELDVNEPDSGKRGVNIVLKLEGGGGPVAAAPPAPPAETTIPGLTEAPPGEAAPERFTVNVSATRITLSLRQIPLMEALRYIADLAGLKIKVDPFAVSLVPQTEDTDVLVTKEYRVPPGFITGAPAGAAAAEGAAGAGAVAGAAAGGTPGGAAMAQRVRAKEFLESNGVQFPQGASANFLPASSRLVVRNTQSNIDVIDALVDAAVGTPPSQVEIESKFVEISQTNTKELSFDLLLGQANTPGGNERVFFGGGTTGTGSSLPAADFPFQTPGGFPVGSNTVTGGNRSGGNAISQNAIDGLLFGTTRLQNAAPGIFSLSGVFTDPQFQVVIRALDQKKGVDLLSAPRVTTKSGQRAVIEIIREFRYPTEFDPPQLPNEVFSANIGGAAGTAAASTFPVTPTTPTAFETRNTGVTLEVEPVVGPDGYTIDLNLVPQVVEFEGFINYGSPISSSAINALGQASTVVITPNVINQPIFSSRKVTTSISIWDGQTVVLGGMIREDVQKIEDKVPLFGDIPLLGRFFRSDVSQHIKRNLVIFVTARLLNPAGEPLLGKEEEEEIIEPLAPPELALPILPEAPVYSK